ncbi:LmeA family phospholipid-binding protein [Microbacterium sp. bgisy189]|uniref:LmeA family phospholipid-binding protein n=1 Tax=Microbacterium sp. bgisy189 TaxID=3413798 RepID=UPI003EBCAA2E
MSGDTQPTAPIPHQDAQWVLSAPAEPKRTRRRRWPWFVALGIVVVLLAVGVVIAEQVARSATVSTVRSMIIDQLDLPADQQLDVEIPGMVLPQLITGTLGEVRVASDDVSFEGLSGAIEVVASGVPIRGDAAADSAHARLTLDQAQLRSLLAQVDGIPVETVTIDDDRVGMLAELDLFLTTIEVGVTLETEVEQGDLVLSPDTLTVAGAELSAGALLEQFGPVAESILGSWTICLADRLPAGLTLEAVTVENDHIVADVDIDGAIIVDEALQQPGTCT